MPVAAAWGRLPLPGNEERRVTRFKLLAVDLDGTLVGPDQQVSERNRRAVAAAKRAGLTACRSAKRVAWASTPTR